MLANWEGLRRGFYEAADGSPFLSWGRLAYIGLLTYQLRTHDTLLPAASAA